MRHSVLRNQLEAAKAERDKAIGDLRVAKRPSRYVGERA